MALIFDLETDGLLDEVSKIHCIVIKDTTGGAVSLYAGGEGIRKALTKLARASCLIGHNILRYDLPVLRKLYPTFKPVGQARDTMVCSRLMWPDLKEKDFEFSRRNRAFPKQLIGRHSLKAWGYRIGTLKGTFGETADWKTFTPEMLEYCKQDVEVTAALWAKIEGKKYSEEAIKLEHEFAQVIFEMEQHGVLFARPKAVELYAELCQKRLDLEKQLKSVDPGWYIEMKVPAYWEANGQRFPTKAAAGKLAKKCVAGPNKRKPVAFNPGSRDHIARLLKEKYAWKPTKFTPEGKPAIDDEVLEGLVYPEAKLLSEYFLIEKRIGQLAEGKEAWLKCETNGRIHGEVNTNGAVTGRCTHSHPNLAQVPACDAPYGNECRSLFIVPPGRKLVGADASGLELRCLGHYMAPFDSGAYAREVVEGDIHTLNQRAAGLPSRALAKRFIYAYLYGAGDAKIGAVVGCSPRDGKRLKANFLSKTPALAALKHGIAAAVKERGYLIGLDGRHLPIRSDHAALNTLLQSAGALVVKKATCLFHQKLTSLGYKPGKDFAMVLHVHDEWQTEAREDIADVIGKTAVASIEEAAQYFKFRCPLTGEYKIGGSWKETH